MKLEEFKPVNQYKAINWNEVSDMIDKATWEKLTEQFWLDTRIPVSNDLDDWRELDDDHRLPLIQHLNRPPQGRPGLSLAAAVDYLNFPFIHSFTS